MKRLLLFIAIIILATPLFSQTNGWHQYTVLRKVNHMVKDASNNLHIATDIGYIKYNTTTNSVEKIYNITTQNPPIGNVRLLAVNPTNNNVALGFGFKKGFAISNGTSITNYTSSSSGLHDFNTPKLYYAKDGTLYIYQGTKYQTFSNGVFSAVKIMTFSINNIIENNDGTKIFFASNSNGLFEFVKATSILTNFTSSNSDLIDNTVFTLFIDGNDTLHIGGNQGLNTLTSAGVWATFQKQIPSTADFYSVFSIDQSSTGDLLLNNSINNFTIQKGYSILNPTTGVWTHHSSSTFCSTSVNIDSLTQLLFIDTILFANFTLIDASQRLLSFSPGNNTCTQHNLNYLGVEFFDANGMHTVTLRENKNDITKLDIGFVNIKFQSNILKKITIPINNFDGNFPPLETVFTNPNAGLLPLKTVVRLNDTFIAGEEGGLWFFEEGGPSTFFPHNITGFKIKKMQKVATRNSTGTGTTDNKITIALDGLDSNFETRVYKTECDISSSTCQPFEELFIDRGLNFEIEYACEDNWIDNKIACVSLNRKNNVVQFVGESWDKISNPLPAVFFTDDVTNQTPGVSQPVHFMDIWSSGNAFSPRPCFAEDNSITDTFIYKCRKDDGTFSATQLDANNSSTIGDEVVEFDRDDPKNQSGSEVVAQSIVAYFRGNIGGFDIKKLNAYFATGAANRGGTVNAITYTILPDVALNVPLDFGMFRNPVVILPYSSTHFAMVLNSNYGLLIKTAIDYSSLILDTKDETFNTVASKLYPNPTNGKVSITGIEVKNITVYDLNGRKVLSATTAEFSVESLATGIYIVRIESKDKGVISKKLIKN